MLVARILGRQTPSPALHAWAPVNDLFGLVPEGADTRPWLVRGTRASARWAIGSRHCQGAVPLPAVEGEGLQASPVGPCMPVSSSPGISTSRPAAGPPWSGWSSGSDNPQGHRGPDAGCQSRSRAQLAGACRATASLCLRFRAVEAAMQVAVLRPVRSGCALRNSSGLPIISATLARSATIVIRPDAGALQRAREQVLRAANLAFGHRRCGT